MATPLISVIIPSYDRAHYLPQAIDSVLGQDYPAVELVVVDDGSSDGTWELLQSYGDQLRPIRQANQGIGGARNTGLANSRGELICYLDSDDIFTPGRLALQAARLIAEPSLHWLQGHLEQFISPELNEAFASTIRVEQNKPMPAPMASTLMIRADAHRQVGPWVTDMTLGTDIDWLTRLTDSGLRGEMLEEVLLRRRIHPGNISLTRKDTAHERLRVIKAALDRRRNLGESTS